MKLEDLMVPLICIGIVFVFVGTFMWMMRDQKRKPCRPNKKSGEVPYYLRHGQDLKRGKP